MTEQKYSRFEKGLHHEQMIEMMLSMGLKIPNIPFAIEVLKSINFHQFVKSYGRKYFIEDSEQFEAGTYFEDIYHLYRFDSSMSDLLVGSLSFSEVRTLSVLVDHYCINYGIFSHADSSNFLLDKLHDEYLKQWNKSYHIQISDIPFYKLYNHVSFGFIDKMINNSKYADRKTICRNLNIKPKYYKFLSAWVRHLNKVRNACAHNNRLYGNLFTSFKLPNTLPSHYQDYGKGVFGAMIIFSFLLDKDDFLELILKIKALEQEYSQFDLNLSVFNFPKDWENILEDIRNTISSINT